MEQGDDFLGLAVRGFAGFGSMRRIILAASWRVRDSISAKKPLPGLLGGQAGDFLQTVFLLIAGALLGPNMTGAIVLTDAVGCCPTSAWRFCSC